MVSPPSDNMKVMSPQRMPGAQAGCGGPTTTPPGESPPTARGELAQQRIQSAARDVFRESGYANARVSDIAEAAGLSTGAFYRYYKDKYHVMLSLVHGLLETGFELARVPWDADHPAASVETTTFRDLCFYEEHADVFKVLVEAAQVFPEVEEMWASVGTAIVDRIERMLRRGKAQGVVRKDVDTGLSAGLLAAMTDHYAYLRFNLQRMPNCDVVHVSEQIAVDLGAGSVTQPSARPPVNGLTAAPGRLIAKGMAARSVTTRIPRSLLWRQHPTALAPAGGSHHPLRRELALLVPLLWGHREFRIA